MLSTVLLYYTVLYYSTLYLWVAEDNVSIIEIEVEIIDGGNEEWREG